jgi:hypothetical protein
MLATMGGMKIVMMRKWIPEQGEYMLLPASHRFLTFDHSCQVRWACDSRPENLVIDFRFRLIEAHNVTVAGGWVAAFIDA